MGPWSSDKCISLSGLRLQRLLEVHQLLRWSPFWSNLSAVSYESRADVKL